MRDPIPLVHDGQATVADDRGPRGGRDLFSLIDQVGDRRPRPRIDHTKRLVHLVTVLGVLQAEQRSVRREAPAVVAAVPPGDAHVLGAPSGLLHGGSAVLAHVDREPVMTADRDREHPGNPGDALVPSRIELREEEP